VCVYVASYLFIYLLFILICSLSPQPDTTLPCETINTELVHCVACLFTTQLLLVLTYPRWEGQGELTWDSALWNYINCPSCWGSIPFDLAVAGEVYKL